MSKPSHDLTTQDGVIARAVELLSDDGFLNSHPECHPHAYSFAVAMTGFRGSFQRWLWDTAYWEARLERAVQLGNAEPSSCGIVYTAVSEEYLDKMIRKELEDICPGTGFAGF